MNPLNLLQSPLVWVPAIGFLLLIVFATIAFRAKSTGKRASFSVLGLISLLLPCWLLVAVFFPQWIDGRHRAYRNFYDDISPGMTREQVLAAMEKNYPRGGPRKRPKLFKDTPEEFGFFMDPEGNRQPNCEGIFLDLSDGKVVQKSYARD